MNPPFDSSTAQSAASRSTSRRREGRPRARLSPSHRVRVRDEHPGLALDARTRRRRAPRTQRATGPNCAYHGLRSRRPASDRPRTTSPRTMRVGGLALRSRPRTAAAIPGGGIGDHRAARPPQGMVRRARARERTGRGSSCRLPAPAGARTRSDRRHLRPLGDGHAGARSEAMGIRRYNTTLPARPPVGIVVRRLAFTGPHGRAPSVNRSGSTIRVIARHRSFPECAARSSASSTTCSHESPSRIGEVFASEPDFFGLRELVDVYTVTTVPAGRVVEVPDEEGGRRCSRAGDFHSRHLRPFRRRDSVTPREADDLGARPSTTPSRGLSDTRRRVLGLDHDLATVRY